MPTRLRAALLNRPLTPAEETAILPILPPTRRARLLKMQSAEKRREPLCAYTLLLSLVNDFCGWQTLPEIALTPSGKPYFPQHPTVHFNLSHTGGAVLAGISDRPIGVDIQRVRPVDKGMLERYAPSGTEEEFFRNWVRWEAQGKRTGEGIITRLHAADALQDSSFYYPLETFPGYAAGVACETTPESLVLWTLDDPGSVLEWES